MTTARVSLCLIARDESAFLGACLASVRDVVDECIVCDTGSTDDTVAIAKAAGATVVFHPWNDDFSAARNVALDAATGDWILVLDADERLLPSAGPLLRKALDTDAFDLGVLPLHHADALDAPPAEVVSGARRHQEPTGLARLFRRTPDLRWEGMIHESPTTWMARPGLRVVHLPIPIAHYGNVPDLRATRAKDARNLALLERHCAAHPTDHPRLTYLARERLRTGDRTGALDAAKKGWHGALQTMRRTGRPAAAAPFSATMAGFLMITTGDSSGCRAVMADARALGLDHPNLALLDATAILEQHPPPDSPELEAAAAALEHALARASDVFVDELLPGATGATAARMLGLIRLLDDDIPAARAALEQSLQAAPADPHTRLALAELHVRTRQPGPALGMVEPLLAKGHPDAWLVAAEAAAVARQRQQVEVLLARAQQTPQPWLDPKRRRRLARAIAEHRAWQRILGLTGGRPPPPVAAPEALRALARQALEAGQLGRAMQVLPSLLATAPADVDAWCLLATACVRQGGIDLGADLLKTATMLSAHHPSVLGVRADIDAARGKLAASRTWRRLQGAFAGEGFSASG